MTLTQLLTFMSPLFIFGAIFYFLIMRPQSKAAKKKAMMIASLVVGDEVITTGGIVGKVESISDEVVIIKSKTSTIEVVKEAIYSKK